VAPVVILPVRNQTILTERISPIVPSLGTCRPVGFSVLLKLLFDHRQDLKLKHLAGAIEKDRVGNVSHDMYLLDTLPLYNRRKFNTSEKLSLFVTDFFFNLLDVLTLSAPSETGTRASITPVVGSHCVVCAFTTHDSPDALRASRRALWAFALIGHILV
jgi:hypothetical protein